MSMPPQSSPRHWDTVCYHDTIDGDDNGRAAKVGIGGSILLSLGGAWGGAATTIAVVVGAPTNIKMVAAGVTLGSLACAARIMFGTLRQPNNSAYLNNVDEVAVERSLALEEAAPSLKALINQMNKVTAVKGGTINL